MVQLNLRRIFAAVVFTVSATPALSDDVSDLSKLADRYTIYDGQTPGLRHWGRSIRPEVVGEVPSDLALYGVSLIHVLSMMADETVAMVGEPETWFTSKSTIGRQSNFVIAFEDLKMGDVKPSFRLKASNLTVNTRDANGDVIDVIESGLIPVGPGCFGQWIEHKENVVSAVALVIDLGTDDAARKACLEFGVITALGVFPESSSYDASGIGRSPAADPFFDTSEVFFLTQLSAYCRNALKDPSVDCAREMIDRIYGSRTGTVSQ
jgi:hypothetical protein